MPRAQALGGRAPDEPSGPFSRRPSAADQPPTPTQTFADETMKTTYQPPKYLRSVNSLRDAMNNSYAEPHSISDITSLSKSLKLIFLFKRCFP